jgi:rod shape-determining protein MreD
MTRILRLSLLIVLVVIVQVSVFPHLRIAGVAPDLGLIVAIAVGVQFGPEAGALAGFAAGFGYDLFLETPLALNALTYALAGGLVLIGIGVLAGVESVKGVHGIETISIAAVYDALLAPIVFLLVALAVRGIDRERTSWTSP